MIPTCPMMHLYDLACWGCKTCESSNEERRIKFDSFVIKSDSFIATAIKCGTSEDNIEKDNTVQVSTKFNCASSAHRGTNV